MQTLGAQTQKVKDEFDDFLELIAKSGAYDFVVGKLKEINEAFKKGLESGKLQEAAKSISDALIALGNAIIGVTKFLVDHRAGILEAAEAYAIFRGALLATNLIEAGSNWVKLTLATKAHTIALGEAAVAQGTYATAAKSADAAALAAAAGGGGLSQARFADQRHPEEHPDRSRCRRHREGSRTPQRTSTQSIKGNNELAKQYNDTEDEIIADRAAPGRDLAGVTQQLKRFADTADRERGSARRKEPGNRVRTYIDSLQNATRYFAALRAQARENSTSKRPMTRRQSSRRSASRWRKRGRT